MQLLIHSFRSNKGMSKRLSRDRIKAIIKDYVQASLQADEDYPIVTRIPELTAKV